MSASLRHRQRPPHALHQSRRKFNNAALVPASELANLQAWQDQARQLRHGELLMVIPCGNLHLQEVVRRICRTLRKQGRHPMVATISNHQQ